MIFHTLLLVLGCTFFGANFALENGLARTPPMGWNSWNHFGCKTAQITETMVIDQAKAIVANGPDKLGYQYVNLDDCYLASTRDADGKLQADPARFPRGMKYLADTIHGLGIKFGIYEDTGVKTCGGYPGSEPHYQLDAQTYAEWGADYVKLDGCYSSPTDMKKIYTDYGNFLNQTGRPMVYSCSWPAYADTNNPAFDWKYVASICNLWREYDDINDSWKSWTDILDYQVKANLSRWAGPGNFNDPDMLEVGNGGQTTTEYRAHFSLWAMLAAPLIMGNDLRNMSRDTLEILSNAEVIAVDQDPLGIQGNRIFQAPSKLNEVWTRPLADKSRAVVLFNRSLAATNLTVSWTDLGLAPAAKATVRDLWKHENLGEFSGSFQAAVDPHGVVMVKVTSA